MPHTLYWHAFIEICLKVKIRVQLPLLSCSPSVEIRRHPRRVFSLFFKRFPASYRDPAALFRDILIPLSVSPPLPADTHVCFEVVPREPARKCARYCHPGCASVWSSRKRNLSGVFFQICFRQGRNSRRPVARWNRKGVFLFALNRPEILV